MRRLIAVGVIAFFAQIAWGDIVISEWMYNGGGSGNTGEYVEFTNTGDTDVDMTGWSYDDDSRVAGTVSLSGFGVVAPGQSVVLTDETADTFATVWGLTDVTIVGGNTANLGRNDEINLFDASGNLVDRLAYGDETYAGTVRTQATSCNIPASDYSYTQVQTTWVLATAGDTYGSRTSTRGEIGSPGRTTPYPNVDFDGDADVDSTDFDTFYGCNTGPAIGYNPLPSACTLTADTDGYIAADADKDGDVDQSDFAVLQRCYSGVGVMADVTCTGGVTPTTGPTYIVLNGTSIAVTGGGVTVSGTTATINSVGTYYISGTLSDGQIAVNTAQSGVVEMILNGINVTNTTTAPISILSAESVSIVLADGTTNYLTDPATYVYPDATTDEPNAALFSKDPVTISGSGTLNVTGNYNDAIASKDNLTISGGTIVVHALDDGIRGKDYLHITGGTITVTSGGDGLKSDNEDDTTLGYITIEGGTINVTSTGDAIAAQTSVGITGGTFTLISGGGSTATLGTDASAKAIKGNTTVTIAGGTFTINSADDGIHSNGSISVENSATNIGVTSGRDGIAGDTTVTIAAGTVSTNTGGGSSVTASDTISAKGIKAGTVLTITGGTITVNAADDGIHSDGSVSIPSGSPNVTVTTAKDGIYGPTVSISSGTFIVTTHGGSNYTVADTLSAKGIKGDTSVAIGGGTFTLNVAEDGIHCNTNVTISGGTVNISASDDAVHAETALTISNATVNITKCVEGLEAFTITLNSGTITIVASDDGINATAGGTDGGTEQNDGSWLYINGGTIAVTSTHDGLDSNGNITMTGGTVVVQGPASAPELAIDFNGTFLISGGVLVASGPNSGNMIQAPSTSSAQYTVKATGTLAASTFFHIQNASGTNIVTFKPIRATYYILFSSSSLTTGVTYSLYTGGTYTGGSNVNGLYTGGTYSAGTLKKSFTMTSKVTAVTF
jgi:hypothetical protein